MKVSIARLAILLVGVTLDGIAQQQTQFAGDGTVTISRPQFAVKRAQNNSYCADEVANRVWISPSGVRKDEPISVRKICRDSSGRVRIETPVPIPAARLAQPDAHPPVLIQITDPVAGYEYALDTVSGVAHRWKVDVRESPPAVPRSDPPGFLRVPLAEHDALVPIGPGTASVDLNTPRHPLPREKAAFEALGRQEVGGVLVEGVRWTTRVAGDGNGGEAFMTTEIWTDPTLRLAVITKLTTPTNETTKRLENLTRVEPAPGLFVIPSGYSLRDEDGAVILAYPVRGN